MNAPSSPLGSRIRHLRRLRSLTQSQVAEAVGVSLTAVCQWERGSYAPDAYHLAMLAGCLDVAPEMLTQDTACLVDPLQESRLAAAIIRAESLQDIHFALLPPSAKARVLARLYTSPSASVGDIALSSAA